VEDGSDVPAGAALLAAGGDLGDAVGQREPAVEQRQGEGAFLLLHSR